MRRFAIILNFTCTAFLFCVSATDAEQTLLAQGELPKPVSAPEAPALPPHGRAALPEGATKWTIQTTEAYKGKQDDIFFVTPATGWYVNGAGKIYRTVDSGKTWTKLLDQPGTYFRCLGFVNDTLGFAGNIGTNYFPGVTDSTPLYRTRDGGNNWEKVSTIAGPPVVGLCAIEIVHYPFINAGNLDYKVRLVATGRVGGPTAFVISDDLGEHWQQYPLPDSAAMAFDVHFLNDKIGFLASATNSDVEQSHAHILRTEDGGKSWKTVYRGKRAFEITWKLSFPTREVGYCTIQSNSPDSARIDRYIAKTTDGGKHWKELPLVRDFKVKEFGVAFVDARHGWVGAMPGGFETTNGGKSWQRAEFGNAVNKIRVVREGNVAHLYAIGVKVATASVPVK